MSFTNSVVDKVYVINLDKDTERLQRVHDELQKHSVAYERFSAVPGVMVGKTHPSLSSFCNTFCTDAMKGCALSHQTIWKDIVVNNHRAALILEDDVVLDPAFDKMLRDIWKQVPQEFDIVYLGCNMTCGDPGAVSTVVNKLRGMEPTKIDENVMSVKGSVGAFGYIISNRAARKLYKVPIHTHIDYQLQFWIPTYKLEAYSVSPLLIHNRDEKGGSNLSEAYPHGLNSILAHVPISKGITASWALNENSLRLGPFNINLLMAILFVAVALLPVKYYPWVFAWIAAEGLGAADLHNSIKYAAFLSVPMVGRLIFGLRRKP